MYSRVPPSVARELMIAARAVESMGAEYDQPQPHRIFMVDVWWLKPGASAWQLNGEDGAADKHASRRAQ